MTSEYGQHDVGFTCVTISGYEIPISVYPDVGPDVGLYPISGIHDVGYTRYLGIPDIVSLNIGYVPISCHIISCPISGTISLYTDIVYTGPDIGFWPGSR